jgi:hypothetical protein
VLTAATRILRLNFSPGATADPPTDTGAEDHLDFVAYAPDCSLAGSLRLDADRLTDMLNAADEIELVDVVRLGLDGVLTEAAWTVIARADLVAVKASPPRGNPAFRQRTRQVPIVAAAGRYVIHGYLHGRPGADPMIHLGRRPAMVPLTEAAIAYETATGWRVDEAETLIVNRDRAESLRPARDDELGRLRQLWGAA